MAPRDSDFQEVGVAQWRRWTCVEQECEDTRMHTDVTVAAPVFVHIARGRFRVVVVGEESGEDGRQHGSLRR